jgi:hypothetical protein
LALPLRHLGQRGAHQVGQGQVLEEDLHELFLAQREDEVVLTLAAVAGIPLPAALPLAALRFANAVAAHVLAVAGVHHLAAAAFTMVEHRLGQIPLRDADVLALFQLTDAAAVDGALHRLAHLRLVATQKALTVADGLVLARQPPVDDVLTCHVGSPPC